jgi:hypothetical protein
VKQKGCPFMSIEIRALNAQYEGSLIEIERDGAQPVTVVASPSLEVLQILRVSDRQALVLLRAFGGPAGEVAMLDIDDREGQGVSVAPSAGQPARAALAQVLTTPC